MSWSPIDSYHLVKRDYATIQMIQDRVAVAAELSKRKYKDLDQFKDLWRVGDMQVDQRYAQSNRYAET